MQYRSVKLFEWHWNDPRAVADLLAVLPRDAYILARDHPLSEQKADMWAAPISTGERHADTWADKLRSGQCTLPLDRTYFLGINEPDATNGDRAAIDRYTVAFLDRLAQHGMRGGAFNFSTGHPRTVDGTPHTKADYTVFEGAHQAIVRGHHLGVLHIYGSGAVPCAPGHYDRLWACPWQDVQWIVGEFGIDEHVIGGGTHYGYQHYFAGDLSGYCAWLDEAIRGINDPRIHSYQVFTYDFSHPWESFDVRPIRTSLERFPWAHAAQGGEHTVHIPAVVVQPVAPEVHPSPHGSNWERSLAFVRRMEGGWADNPADPGGATMYGITLGTFTRWRQAQRQGTPSKEDLRAITDAEANRIYWEWYWLASGADKMAWPMCLAHFDLAVNGGVGRAYEAYAAAGHDFLRYMAWRLRWYTRIEGWPLFGSAWVRRCAELLDAAR